MNFRKIIQISLVILLIPVIAFSQNYDVIIKAMKDEIDRSMKDLYLEELEKPYYIEYRFNKTDYVNIKASLGEIISDDYQPRANLTVDLRVGDYKFDNTNFMDFGFSFFGSGDDEESFKKRSMPLDPDYNSMRRNLWLATDAAYKQISEVYSKKLSVLKNRVINDTTHDFTKVTSVQIDNLKEFPGFSREKYSNMIKELSAIFKDFPDIDRSIVGIEYIPERKIVVNSEGTVIKNHSYYAGLEVVAIAQSNDGMPLMNMYTTFAKNTSNFPSIDSLKKAVKTMAAKLVELKKADVLKEVYSGPIIFEGQAAAQLFAQVFAPNLVTQRMPLTERGIQESDRFTAFQTKIGGRVLPEFLSVDALPNMKAYKNIHILGSYEFDEDGIKSQDIKLVKDGFLKSLMSSRIPTRRVKASNGHKRGGASMISTLKLSSKEEKVLSRNEMIDRMLKLCKDRELEYGIVVKAIPDQNVQFTTLNRISSGKISFPRSESKKSLLEVYKVYHDGREELIRGSELKGISVQSFKDILNIGNDDYVLNYLAPSITSSYFTGGSAFVGATIIAPSILFEDGEIKPVESDFPKPPIIANPISVSKK